MSGPVKLARKAGTGDEVVTYLPGTVLAVKTLPPQAGYGRGLVWSVAVLTMAGWEVVASWNATTESENDEAQFRATSLAEVILRDAESNVEWSAVWADERRTDA